MCRVSFAVAGSDNSPRCSHVRRADHVSTSVRQDVVVPEEQSEAALDGTGATDQLDWEIAALRQESLGFPDPRKQ